MEYVIRAFNKELGQIVVEYAGQWTFALDLPIENGAFPIGEQLEEVIQGMSPTWLAERKAALATQPANAEIIESLVQPVIQPVIQPEPNN